MRTVMPRVRVVAKEANRLRTDGWGPVPLPSSESPPNVRKRRPLVKETTPSGALDGTAIVAQQCPEVVAPKDVMVDDLDRTLVVLVRVAVDEHGGTRDRAFLSLQAATDAARRARDRDRPV